MVIQGGDSLEENFLLEGSSSDDASSNAAASDVESDVELTVKAAKSVNKSGAKRPATHDPAEAKKPKLNWREAATSSSGDSASQRAVIANALIAAAKYFPTATLPFIEEDLYDLCFIDCSQFVSEGNKSVRDMLDFVRTKSDALNATSDQPCRLNSLLIAGTSTRGMYLVKEVRELDASLSPIPLFFHGGGRKKEQARTHESVLKGNKASVAVCLPARLKSLSEDGLIDYSKIQLVVLDLKQNEKKLNLLSQKETLLDLLEVFGKFIIPNCSTIKIALL